MHTTFNGCVGVLTLRRNNAFSHNVQNEIEENKRRLQDPDLPSELRPVIQKSIESFSRILADKDNVTLVGYLEGAFSQWKRLVTQEMLSRLDASLSRNTLQTHSDVASTLSTSLETLSSAMVRIPSVYYYCYYYYYS